jgi:hypothetical protein
VGSEWFEQHKQWDDPYRQGGQVRAWLWLTEAT